MLDWIFRLRPLAPVPLVLYTRRGCHLCEVMKEEIERARLRRRYSLTEVDVDQDPELARDYGESLPVLLIGGRKAFKGRVSAGELERKFARLAEEWERASELAGMLDERARGAGGR